MPNWYRSSVSTLLQDANRLFGNAKDDAEIAAKLALFKVTAADLDAGLALIQAVKDTSEDLGGEETDRSQATRGVRAAVGDVEGDFAQDRDMARTVYARDSAEYADLKLRGEIPDARSEVLGAARTFYGKLQERPALIDPIPGLTPETVAERAAAVEAAATVDRTQAKEKGEVDDASGDRKKVVALLRDRASKTSKVARRALADRPQLLEKLGLLARS